MPSKQKSLRFIDILPWIWMVAAFLFTFIFIYFKGKYYVDSDMAGEMILADLLNKEGGILSYTWYYSSELRIFYLQILYRLTLLLFPNNWWLARVIGQALWVVALLLSYFFLCGKNGLNLNNSGVLGAACLACPFGIWYFWYGAYGGFYIPHMILLLVCLGLIVRLIRFKDKTKIIIYSVSLILVSFINGLGSVKGLMGLYVPVCLASFIVFVYKKSSSREIKKEKRLFIISIISLISSSIGYLANILYLSKGYSLFISNHSRVLSNISITKFIKVIGDFLSLLGNQNPGYWDTNVRLFSLSGILGLFCFLTILILIFSIFTLIKKYKKLDIYSLLIITLFICIVFVQGSVFAFTSGNDIPNASYWLTPLPIVFVVIDLGINNIDYEFSKTKQIVSIVLLLSITLTSIASVNTYFNAPLRSRPKLKNVYEFLIDNNYTQGYASLWNSNVITEWSNGKIEMWTAYFYKDECPSLFPYLQLNTHNIPPVGEFFIITTNQELADGVLTELKELSKVVYDDGEYIVMTYDNYDLLNRLVSSLD